MSVETTEAFALRDYRRIVVLPTSPRRRDFLKVLFGHWLPTVRVYRYKDTHEQQTQEDDAFLWGNGSTRTTGFGPLARTIDGPDELRPRTEIVEYQPKATLLDPRKR